MVGKLFTERSLTLFLFILFLSFWFLTIFSNTFDLKENLPPGDFQRDTAIILNIQNGNILLDANYLGERAWYP